MNTFIFHVSFILSPFYDYRYIYFYRKCPSDLIVFLTQKIINNLRVQWAAEPKLFGYRPEKEGLYFFLNVLIYKYYLNKNKNNNNYLSI